MKKRLFLSLLLVSVLHANEELAEIKEQLKTQQLQLDALQMKNTNQSASFSQNAYMPEMAFILNMSALSRNVSNSDYETYNIPGFIDNANATPNELPYNAKSGFNFNYAEVALSSTVDPYFDAFIIFHLSPDEFEIEEAYVKTRALDFGLRVKTGKFRSSFGRINAKHQHVWNFDSQPIIYESIFGVEANNDAGVQLQWVAPSDTYLMLGLEAMQGTNEQSFGDTQANNQTNAYIKSSVDIGDDLSLLAGLSYAHGTNTTTNATDIYGADMTLRYQLGSYSSLIWQSEYLDRTMDLGSASKDKQAGLYSELNYEINNNYSFAFRYDAITKNEAASLSAYTVDTNNLDRYTAKLDYKPFEMSRFRLQYTQDNTKVIAGERKNFHEILLSLNISAGAHSAHDY